MRLIPLKKKYYTGVQIRDVIDEVCTDSNDVLEILSRFAAIKTDDVEPIRHGEWKNDRLVTTSGGTYGVRRCSECEAYYQDIGYGWNYCPNCGALMDRGKT